MGGRARTLSRAAARGVPVLIGTRSVAASEEVARVLAEAALPAVVLNAKQDADEAALVGRAGRSAAS